jgi:hypothetical protein
MPQELVDSHEAAAGVDVDVLAHGLHGLKA